MIAPDLIGFGRSDKPTEIGWYSYDRHVASIERLVVELGLERLTVVVHDWGGPIGLRVAVENDARVDRLVILDTGISAGRPPSEMWLRFRAVVREVGGDLDIGRLVEAGTAQGLSDDVRAAYDAPFPTAESKAGALAFPELVPTEPEHPSTAAMNRVRDALVSWEKPALVVWGADDSVLPRARGGAVRRDHPRRHGTASSSTAHRTSSRRTGRPRWPRTSSSSCRERRSSLGQAARVACSR